MSRCSSGLVHNQKLNGRNPPYTLTTTPHRFNKRPGYSAPTSMKLYERSFQGPFPDISSVDFTLDQPYSGNKLIVEPIPRRTMGGALKRGKKKKNSVVRKKKNSVVRKKKNSVVRKKKNSVVRRKKNSVVRRKKNQNYRSIGGQ